MVSRLLAAGMFAAAASAADPNFMIFMADDQEFYFDESPVPKYRGGNPPTLSGMNRVRDEGTVFLRAYAASTMCAPSRFALLTGRYASRGEFAIRQATRNYGSDPNWDGRPSISVPTSKIQGNDNPHTTARTLSDAGYRTIMAGKWHLATGSWQDDYPGLISEVKDAGFTDPVAVYYDNLVDGNQASDGTVYSHNLEWMVASALEVVQDAVDKDEKFYLYFAPTAPHSPSPYDATFLDVRATPSGWLDQAPVTTMRSRAEIRSAGNNVAGIVAHLWVDEALTAMIDGLDTMNVLDTTMIILCMDHGMGAKSQNYEGGARILQAVRYPPLAVPGSVVSSVVSNVDISATITDIAGLTPAYTVEGRSWKNDLQGAPPSTTLPKFIELGMDVSVVAGRYKFFSLGVFDTKANTAYGTYPYFFDCIQLYDVVTDGGEQINLARDGSNSDVVALFESYVTCHVAGIDNCVMPVVENVQLAVANFGNSLTQTGTRIDSVPTTCTPLPPTSPPTPPTPTPPTPVDDCSSHTTRRACNTATCSATSSPCTWASRACSC
eukprot:TRINITY_DN21305_c0_g1_i1.p1 TRINITY_DN21305_c0_g1~~TRINITY_DN21305_c0_g1_i1.p1  ORF type:complete len:550 (+),score=128.42 TRINITY_DN21305_c0_g1_i1:50-1699(+)